jgi:hypothetical protein
VFHQGSILASIGEVPDGLLFAHSLTRVAQLRPPHEIVTIRLIRALLAVGLLTEMRRSLVSAGEVLDERLLEVKPRVDA